MSPPSPSGAQSPRIHAVAAQYPPTVNNLAIIGASISPWRAKPKLVSDARMTKEARRLASEPREGVLDDPDGPVDGRRVEVD